MNKDAGVITFKRTGYVEVEVKGRELNRSESIRVIRAFKYGFFRIGKSVTVDPSDKFERFIYSDIIETVSKKLVGEQNAIH